MASVFVLGGSGRVGRLVVKGAMDRGWTVTAQTRDGGKLTDVSGHCGVVACDPRDGEALHRALPGHDSVIFALGDRSRHTTLFTDVTRVLLPAMAAAGVRRLIVVTGVGAGETRGHGGFLYDRVIYPLFTRGIYADKDRQEAMIEASELDWVIVRPAPFAATVPDGPLSAVTEIRPETRLTRITCAEVAAFVLDQVESDRFLRKKVFVGHP